MSPYGYTVNYAGNSISKIDLTTYTTVGPELVIGTQPNAIAIDSTGSYAYIANGTGNSISKINLSTFANDGSLITTGVNLTDIVIDATDAHAYAVNYASGTVTKINLSTFTAVGSDLAVGKNPRSIALDPRNAYAYVTNYGDNTVSKIDLSSFAIATTALAVGVNPFSIVIDPTGTYAYVANYGDNTVTKINLSTFATVGSAVVVGATPISIAIDRAGSYAYTANYGGNTVTKIDLSTFTTVGSALAVGNNPDHITVDPTSTYAYTTNTITNTVTKIHLSTFTTIGPDLAVGNDPSSIAIAPAPYFTVGAPYDASSLASTTITPSAAGNLIVIFYVNSVAGTYIPAVPSGGGVAEWYLAGNEGNSSVGAEIFWGVANTTAPSTLTFTGGSGGGTFDGIMIQEFVSSAIGTWWLDSVAYTNGSAASGNMAPVYPAYNDQLYVGVAANHDTGNVVTGSSVGYVYLTPGASSNRAGLAAFDLNASNPNTYDPNWANAVTTTFITISAVFSVRDDVLWTVEASTNNLASASQMWDFTTNNYFNAQVTLPDKSSGRQSGCVYNNVIYFGPNLNDPSPDVILTYDGETNTLGRIPLLGGSSSYGYSCVLFKGVIYFLESRSTGLALYKYDPVAKALTLLTTGIPGGEWEFATDGVHVWTYTSGGGGNSTLWQTEIATGTILSITIAGSGPTETKIVLDQNSQYLYFGWFGGFGSQGNYCINVPAMTVNTSNTTTAMQLLACDNLNRLWYVLSGSGVYTVGYYTAPNFTGGSSVSFTPSNGTSSLMNISFNRDQTKLGVIYSSGTYYSPTTGVFEVDMSTLSYFVNAGATDATVVQQWINPPQKYRILSQIVMVV